MKKDIYIKFWPIVIALLLIPSAQVLFPLPAQLNYNSLFVLLAVAIVLYFLLTNLNDSKALVVMLLYRLFYLVQLFPLQSRLSLVWMKRRI